MAEKYPKRLPYFAHKFLRSLIKQAVAQEIGAEGMCLLTVIAMTEDAKGYAGAVTFFNGQLMPLCGFGTERRLIEVRRKCVEHGLLHYQPGGKGVAGKYWCISSKSIRDDRPVDENPDELSLTNSTVKAPEKAKDKCQEKRSESVRTSEGQPSVILPKALSPKPEPKKESASAEAGTSKSGGYSPEFDQAWEAYRPTFRGGQEKPRAFQEWKKAVGEIRARDGVGDAHLWLLSRIQAYARSSVGLSKYSPTMERWLKKGKFDDDESKWVADELPFSGGRQSVAEHNANVARRVFSRSMDDGDDDKEGDDPADAGSGGNYPLLYGPNDSP